MVSTKDNETAVDVTVDVDEKCTCEYEGECKWCVEMDRKLAVKGLRDQTITMTEESWNIFMNNLIESSGPDPEMKKLYRKVLKDRLTGTPGFSLPEKWSLSLDDQADWEAQSDPDGNGSTIKISIDFDDRSHRELVVLYQGLPPETNLLPYRVMPLPLDVILILLEKAGWEIKEPK